MLVLGATDALMWLAAFAVAAFLRFDTLSRDVPWRSVLTAAVVAAAIKLAVGGLTRLYAGRHRIGSADDATATALAVLATGAVTTALVLAWPGGRLLPLSVPVVAAVLALLATVGLRFTARRLQEATQRPQAANRALVVGAGEIGSKLVRDMLTDPNSPYLPVALVDDDTHKRHLRVSGVRVRGTLDDIGRLVPLCDVQTVIVAIADPPAALVRRISEQARGQGVSVKVMPTLSSMLGRTVGLGDLRDIELADLLGRHQIDTDVESIAGYITGRRVLVTGAGGSIGSELCRQISRFGPVELIMLDRDESALHSTQLSLNGRALLDTPDVVLADIRDYATLERIFVDRRPDVVFHAAALKHLPMLEQYPDEAWKTNVVGSLNVLDAAQTSGVGVFVNISTDKAANPTSVLGYSKRIAERLTAAVAYEAPGRYLSVRFGNVLGSRGSVLTAFADQIAHGGPVTVTHPEVTRYFMTVPEAVQLVIQAAAIGRDGEALVLDMGEPVRILDVAHQLISMWGRDTEVVFTGLRPGEKLHEELLAPGEAGERPEHPLIQHIHVQRLPSPAAAQLRETRTGGGSAPSRPAIADHAVFQRMCGER